jgi:urease accessory protein UreH
VLIDSFAAGRVARNEAWCFARLESALRARDAQGWLAIDRFALRGEPRWAGLGFCEDRPYFATMLIVADRGLDRFCAEVNGEIPEDGGATAAAALLPRRAALVRGLASTAPALTTLLADLWALARRRLLDLPPLDLRKF